MINTEDLGSVVFEEMCADVLGYNSILCEYTLPDHYGIPTTEHRVVMLCSELGKTPKKVGFSIVVSDVKDV